MHPIQPLPFRTQQAPENACIKYVALVLLYLTKVTAQPITIHPENPHYFLFKGRPTVLVGSGEHYGAVMNLEFDYDRYLETMQNDGQNLTRLFSGAYVEKLGAFGIRHNTLAPAHNKFLPPWARSDAPGYINGGNKFDLERFNPDYFIRLKDFVKEAGERGIVVEVVLFSSIYSDENWRHMPFHPENNVNGIGIDDRKKCNTLDAPAVNAHQERMVRKIVRELNDFDNIYYEIQNEPWADQGDSVGVILEHLIDDRLPNRWQNLVEVASPASMAWQAKMAAIIVAEEKELPKKHLIAQNYCNFGHPVKEVDANITIMNFHYALPQCVGINFGWNRPISFDESGFSGPGPDVYRRQAWRFILSGGAVFNGLDYSFYPGYEDGTGELAGPGGGGGKLRQQLAILRHFIESFDLAKLRPDRTSLVHHPGLFVYLLSAPGEQYAGYVEGKAGVITLHIPSGNYTVKWRDATSGDLVQQVAVTCKDEWLLLSTPKRTEEAVFDLRRN